MTAYLALYRDAAAGPGRQRRSDRGAVLRWRLEPKRPYGALQPR